LKTILQPALLSRPGMNSLPVKIGVQLLTLILMSFLGPDARGQKLFDIILPNPSSESKCKECVDLIVSRPMDTDFYVFTNPKNEIYMLITRKEWFDAMMKNSGDGLALDIVTKKRYNCTQKKIINKKFYRGEVQKPIYLKELKKNIITKEKDSVIIKLGRLPEKFKGEEIEFNLIFIKSKHYCYYYTWASLDRHRFKLLNMGLFFDTLKSNAPIFDSIDAHGKIFKQHQKLRFEIPFQMNKSSISQADIKHIQSTIKKKNLSIKKTTILAYTSIEGDQEFNRELLEKRMNSIFDVVKEFHDTNTIMDLQAKENWVDFLIDVSDTKYSELAYMSKEEIRSKLEDRRIINALKPILKNHRKAIIIMELEQKDLFEDHDEKEILQEFSKSIIEKNIVKALEIQNSIFEKIRTKESSVDILEKLEIPEAADFGELLSKNILFKYLLDVVDIVKTYKELSDLESLIPDDRFIKYNLCVLKFQIWLLDADKIEPKKFKKELEDLLQFGIDSNLVKRMLINYEILMCEIYYKERQFSKIPASIAFINSTYTKFPLTDYDYLGLAKYYTSYKKSDWATKLLEKKVAELDVNEDVLFYYINLTITNYDKIKSPRYQAILMNANERNRIRFCKLFDPYGKGGITFQLLENSYLRKNYCFYCN
jgi:hypothetical protein